MEPREREGQPASSTPLDQERLIERARTAGGSRFAELVERLWTVVPPSWSEDLVSCVEDLRQTLLEDLSAEEALQALARATARLLQELSPADPRIEFLLAWVEGEPPRSTGSRRPGHLPRASGAARGGQGQVAPEQHAAAATLWE
ncbi:hypothetical protein KTAU_31220 [Thermogemmatispora aurantia]|uniref:hypothetical protein n=1 Tax=Thermogemmatispora aurantia TaxID=2045279 RepID=UPI00124E7ACD|nr:hypothetical protein [Thermogemmatispora aurantia]GER84486.1 hypothetical protein KTAU_31220 [Thermogemmatispora aurantia]